MPAVNFETVAETLQILESFNGLPSLKQLQAHLNLDPENAPISRNNWKSGHADCLMADPVITANIGGKRGLFEQEQGFKVIYCRLQSPELRLTHERDVVGELIKRYPYALYVFSDAPQKRFHFLNVKDEPSGQKRRLFRRITIGNGERARTAAEQLSQIDGESLREAPLSAVQQRFDQAFDVGPVTKRFYQEYRRVFEEVRDAVKGFPGGDKGKEARNLFTQRLFNRLMFLRFIQKKGWMTMDGSTDYLAALWESHQKLHQTGKNFYEDRLRLLFAALNNERTSIVLQGKGGAIERTIGRVKYLNGGLFEETPEDKNPGVTIPDKPFGLIFDRENGLFEVFNFTITESTPLDVEVAVDPEMLGKIFEELVTGRHESGSYYTPKPIVSFMCREALKGYLETAASGENKEALGRFVDEHEPAGIRDAEAVLNALRRVTVCDPACGSGAYLLGMMHELLDLRESLFRQRRVDSLTVYQRKLEIIQNNIYGVDIDSFAVGIARLRLWLSLAVDYEGPEPQPLPNLDYKIEVGDSVCSPSPIALQGGLYEPLIDQFLQLKKRYLVTHDSDKSVIREQVAELRRQIMHFTNRDENSFDWVVDFAEVFAEKGFDVTLANPPYVRADAQFKFIEDEDERAHAVARWSDYRKHLKASGDYETLKEKWDLFIPFLERSFGLLRNGGMLAFIIPDAYNANKYADASHEYFLENSKIIRIDFCSEVNIFEAGVHNTIVFFKRSKALGSMPVRVLHSSPDVDEFLLKFSTLTSQSQHQMGSALFRPADKAEDISFASIPLSRICYISKGMVLHSHERRAPNQFKAEDLVSQSDSGRNRVPYIEGKQLERWQTKTKSFLEYGTRRCPALVSRPTFPQLFDVQCKLISADIASDRPLVSLDRSKLRHNQSAWSFVPWHLLRGVRNRSLKKSALYRREVRASRAPETTREDLEELSRKFLPEYLLAIMNSAYAIRWLRGSRRNKLHIYPDDWRNFPVPDVTLTKQERVAKLARAILEAMENGTPQSKIDRLEIKIDAEVDRLTGK